MEIRHVPSASGSAVDGVQAALTCGVPSARVGDAISRGRVVFAVKANRNDYAEMQETVSFGPGPGANDH